LRKNFIESTNEIINSASSPEIMPKSLETSSLFIFTILQTRLEQSFHCSGAIINAIVYAIAPITKNVKKQNRRCNSTSFLLKTSLFLGFIKKRTSETVDIPKAQDIPKKRKNVAELPILPPVV
jgi:fibronectin type 3 domain-containing protein